MGLGDPFRAEKSGHRPCLHARDELAEPMREFYEIGGATGISSAAIVAGSSVPVGTIE